MKNLFLIAAALMFAAACSPNGGDGPVEPAKPIELTTRGAEKVSADNAFAFEFFRQTLANEPETSKRLNAFVSPLSLTMALGMLYNGTSPEAAAEMATALGVADFTPAEINEHYRTLYRALLDADPRTVLAIANSIWAKEGFAVKPAFYNINRDNYGAEVRSLPFDAAAVAAINKWCADNTAGRIPEILDQIPPDAVMYLINAVYFKGAWKFEFAKSDTRDEDFTLADGSTRRVKMMSQETDLPGYADGTMQCVDLPYGNGAFSMMVMMPADENTPLDDLIAALDAETYGRTVDGLSERGVALKLPRWKQECEFKLIPAMQSLGMNRIFGRGNLTGINDDPRLAVTGITQKTFVEVNEEGTEAAAVTAVEVGITAVGPGGQMQFHADRPFLYLIRERSTGAILFMGRMDEPQI